MTGPTDAPFAIEGSGTPEAIEAIHAEAHDAIVEPLLEDSDVVVPVITCGGMPAILAMMLVEQADPVHLRTYSEKRDLVESEHKYQLLPFLEEVHAAKIADYTRRLAGTFFPFDYGRFEFRFDPATGQIRFLEVNLNCNLWPEKVLGKSAELIGWNHDDLIETILCESLSRHGLLAMQESLAA